MSLKDFLFPPRQISFLKSFVVPALPVLTSVDYSYENYLKRFMLFSPFFVFQIWNNSNAELEITFNYDIGKVLPCARQSAASRKNIPFENFQIKNVSASIASSKGDIVVIIEKIT